MHGLQLRAGQQTCGALLLKANVVEFATGEGKTAAILPPALHLALQGRRVWIATANDYLAERDAAFARAIAESFQLTVGVVTGAASRAVRQQAYQAAVVYGTMREFVFDFLRDRLHPEQPPIQVMRDVLICDEADSLLIDDAQTPCVISVAGTDPTAREQALTGWAARFSQGLVWNEHFIETAHWGVALTPAGWSLLHREQLHADLKACTLTDLGHAVEISLRAQLSFREGEHYVVRDGAVQLIDEATGRIGPGRTWTRGIQQAIEAWEHVPLSPAPVAAASCAIQRFVRGFALVSGLTGTAKEAAPEFREEYGLSVRSVPEHVPSRRQQLPERGFATQAAKLAALTETVKARVHRGQAVLIGTRTVNSSDEIAALLTSNGIAHVVLNARQSAREHEIIAQAGQPGQVTVATNMAGRGTDIRLHPQVRDAGGLHVIATELHNSRRIDRQLMGRCGRQGDPGSHEQWASLEDDLIAQAKISLTEGVGRSETIMQLARKAQNELERNLRWRRQALRQTVDDQYAVIEQLGLDPLVNPFPED